MVGTLLALVLLAAAPDATPTASPSPTPFPVQDLPSRPLPAPTPFRRELPDMAIVPSIGVGGFVRGDRDDGTIAGTHVWAGVLLHPAPSRIGPFMGLGVSFDSRDGDQWYGMLEMRYGIAWLVSPANHDAALLPKFELYAIGGWRPEPGSTGLYRAGGGIASPRMFSELLMGKCLPIPTMVEVVVDGPDGDFSGAGTTTTLRGGWQF